MRHRWATSHGKRKKDNKQTSKKIVAKRNSTKSNRLFMSIHRVRIFSDKNRKRRNKHEKVAQISRAQVKWNLLGLCNFWAAFDAGPHPD
jgi:hypothetical protein